MVFSNNSVEVGRASVIYCRYCNGAWDVHLKRVLDNGRKKVNQLHSIISMRDIILSARTCRLLLLHSCMDIHVRVCVAPPIVVGAWPMAETLWQ